MEGDLLSFARLCGVKAFQSTPSVWRETADTTTSRSKEEAFQSTPSVWRETVFSGNTLPVKDISIHSLRMEGDV